MQSVERVEAANLAEIERLNQRGGRTLSFVDLIEAGTVSAELAGELAALVESGASIVTAARHGGVGKSTLLADLLACLPPGERIVTTSDLASVEEAKCASEAGSICYLAHEIGPGPWYAYLWRNSAAGFFALAREGRRVATCLHADELEEFYEALASQGVAASDVNSVGIVAFMRRAEVGRRVESVYVPGPKAHSIRWLREEAEDVFLAEGPSPVPSERADEFARLFEDLTERGVREFDEVRLRLAAVLRPAG